VAEEMSEGSKREGVAMDVTPRNEETQRMKMEKRVRCGMVQNQNIWK